MRESLNGRRAFAEVCVENREIKVRRFVALANDAEKSPSICVLDRNARQPTNQS